MAKVTLTRQALFVLGDLIRAHCHADERGFAIYDAPWTDKLIHEEFSKTTKCSLSSVVGLRAEIVGKLITARGGPVRKEFAKELAQLQQRVTELERWAAGRKMLPYKLVWEICHAENEGDEASEADWAEWSPFDEDQ